MTNVQIRPGVATVVLSVTGAGTAQLGPSGARETWMPQVASVSVATHAKEAQCRIYIGDSPIPANFIDGTLSGSSGDSTDRVAGKTLSLGDFIWAVWSGGDPGAVATLNVSGEREV
jgi:hypothetical protein